jgi:putative Mg2+ transporter-C (MgtC) family protein
MGGISLDDINIWSICLRTFMSIVLGGLLGLERGSKNRPAGFRTYMLVCFGSALVMMTNQFVHQKFGTSDPVRMGAQVISGIGFLGAGSIIVTGRNQVKGITTAAGLWASACVGLAVGIGFYLGAIIGGIMIFLIMAVMQRIDARMRAYSSVLSLYVEFDKEHPLSEFLVYAHEHSLEVFDVQIEKNKLLKNNFFCVTMSVKSTVAHKRNEIITLVHGANGIQYLEEL